MLLLFVTNYNIAHKIDWSLFPAIFWGAGLIMHAIVYKVYLANRIPKKRKRIARKDKLRSLIRTSPKTLAKKIFSKDKEILDKSVISQDTITKLPKNVVKANKVKKTIKPKVKSSSNIVDLDDIEKEELETTESEVDVEEKEFICIVHKGNIVGAVYICPNCKTFYCVKCAKVLKEKEEKCWSCHKEIEL